MTIAQAALKRAKGNDEQYHTRPWGPFARPRMAVGPLGPSLGMAPIGVAESSRLAADAWVMSGALPEMRYPSFAGLRSGTPAGRMAVS